MFQAIFNIIPLNKSLILKSIKPSGCLDNITYKFFIKNPNKFLDAKYDATIYNKLLSADKSNNTVAAG